MNTFWIIVALVIAVFSVILNIVLVINIVKAGKYSEKTYFLLEKAINANQKLAENSRSDHNWKNSNIKDVWNEVNK